MKWKRVGQSTSWLLLEKHFRKVKWKNKKWSETPLNILDEENSPFPRWRRGRREQIPDKIEKPITGIALGDRDVNVVHHEDVDEVGVIVGGDDGGSSAVNRSELKGGAVLAKANSLHLSPLDNIEELTVSLLGALWEVRGRLGLGLW